MSKQPQSTPGSDQWRGMTPQRRDLSTAVVDDVFEALSDWRRRAVCHYFSTCDDSTAEVETLAAAVAKRGAVSSAPTDETTQAAIREQLVETHLPVLHRLGLVDFDRRSGAVKYWGSPTVEKWAEHAAAVAERDEF